jgi:hypothetical protein
MIDEFHFSFKISLINQELVIKVMNNFELWKNKFSFEEIQTLPQWNSFKNTSLMVNFISNSIDSKNIEASLGSNNPVISFKMNTQLDGITINFLLPVRYIKLDYPKVLEELPAYITELQSRIDYKIKLIDQRFESSNCEELREENKRLREEIVDLKLGKKISTEFLQIPGFDYNSNNRSIIKAGHNDWRGVRCNRILYNNGRQYFSVKIEYTSDASFMFGFCSTNIRAAPHVIYHRQIESYMFYMKNGAIYENSNPIKNIQSFIKPVSGDIFDVVIDYVKETIYLYKDGQELGFSSVKLNGNYLTPCFDLHSDKDSISLI